MTSCYVGGFATQEGHDMPSKKHGTHTQYTPWSVCVSHPSDKSPYTVGGVLDTSHVRGLRHRYWDERVTNKLTVRKHCMQTDIIVMTIICCILWNHRTLLSRVPNHCIDSKSSKSTALRDNDDKEICHQTRPHNCKKKHRLKRCKVIKMCDMMVKKKRWAGTSHGELSKRWMFLNPWLSD